MADRTESEPAIEVDFNRDIIEEIGRGRSSDQPPELDRTFRLGEDSSGESDSGDSESEITGDDASRDEGHGDTPESDGAGKPGRTPTATGSDDIGSGPPPASADAHEGGAGATAPPGQEDDSGAYRMRMDSAPSLKALTLRPPSKDQSDGSDDTPTDGHSAERMKMVSFFPESDADANGSGTGRDPSDSAPSLQALTIPPAPGEETRESLEFSDLGLGLDPDKLPSIDPPPLPKDRKSSSFAIWAGAATIMLGSAVGGAWLATSQGWLRNPISGPPAAELEASAAEATAAAAETPAANLAGSEPASPTESEQQKADPQTAEPQTETDTAASTPDTTEPPQVANRALKRNKKRAGGATVRKPGKAPASSGAATAVAGKSGWEPVANAVAGADTPAPAEGPDPSSPELVDEALAEALSKAPDTADKQDVTAGAVGDTAQPSEATPAPILGPVKETLERKDVAAGMEKIRGALVTCAGDRHGIAKVNLTIANSGRVTKALVEGVFAGTKEGSCIARTVRGARFPRFKGSSVEVSFPFTL